MFGRTYRIVNINDSKGTIKLAPTRKRIIATMAVNALVWMGFSALVSSASEKSKQRTAENTVND